MNYQAADVRPKRKPARLNGFDYSTAFAYHVVLVTLNRQKLFGAVNNEQVVLNEEGLAVEEMIRQIPVCYPRVAVDTYAVMPDHVHMLIRIEAEPGDTARPDLRKIVSALKSLVSRRCGRPIWQRSFYDHIIRNDQDYRETAEYIQSNPVAFDENHGLRE